MPSFACRIHRRPLAVAAAFLAAAALTPCAHAQTYGLGTMQPGTLSYTGGAAIAKVMQEKLGLQTRVQPNAGESVILPLLQNGEVDLGIANIFEISDAYDGKAGPKLDKLRLVGALYPLRVGFFVRKDSGIKSIADLKGKRVTLGFAAQSTIQQFALAVLATGGLTEKDVKPVLVPNLIRSADEFANGNADAFVFGLGAAKVKEVDSTVGGVRFVAVPNSPEALAAARKTLPTVYLSVVDPHVSQTGVLEPTTVLTYDHMLATNTAVKDDVIYKVVDAMVANKPELVAVAPWMREMTERQLYKKFPVPYHPGAVKWFQEKGVPPQD